MEVFEKCCGEDLITFEVRCMGKGFLSVTLRVKA